LFKTDVPLSQFDQQIVPQSHAVLLLSSICDCVRTTVDWEAAGLMIFRLAYENCGLNPAKPDFFSAGCGLAKLRLASRLSRKNRSTFGE